MRGGQHIKLRRRRHQPGREQDATVPRLGRPRRHEDCEPLGLAAGELFEPVDQQPVMCGRFMPRVATPIDKAATDRAALRFGRRLAARQRFMVGAMLTNDMEEGAQLTVPLPVPWKKSGCASSACAASASAAASDSSRASSASSSSGLRSVNFFRMIEASIICSGRP